MRLAIDTRDIRSYRLFLRAKQLPRFAVRGGFVEIPDEYAGDLGLAPPVEAAAAPYTPHPSMFDYQRDIAAMAVAARKFAVFADCGLGKTLIELDYARHAAAVLPTSRRVLILCPLMVVEQTVDEARRFYGDGISIAGVASRDLQSWLDGGSERIGVCNYEALSPDLRPAGLGALILDESSMLKSHYGAWGAECIRLGKGLRWKLCLTGTPAPNDRIEYANHAVFLDQFPTVNAFLARYFVNRGQTDNRWELKPHAVGPFYRSLASWSIFLTRPGVYGWKDNAGTIPPIRVHIHDVPLTAEQREATQDTTGALFATEAGGITTRQKLGQIAKGSVGGVEIPTNKPAFIRDLIASWPDESTIVWCLYNAEQDAIERAIPGAVSIRGETPYEQRVEMIRRFKAGEARVLISKPKVLGFGLNLQIATRQVFSGLQDSYEQYYQAVKRSNRYGSTRPLNVHIPVTELERPMVDSVLRKAHRVEEDARAQEELFRAAR